LTVYLHRKRIGPKVRSFFLGHLSIRCRKPPFIPFKTGHKVFRLFPFKPVT
jgi:hypothetical protein